MNGILQRPAARAGALLAGLCQHTKGILSFKGRTQNQKFAILFAHKQFALTAKVVAALCFVFCC